jgi:predicted DCC family thiol-disulfide oxidoreductase YuxK
MDPSPEPVLLFDAECGLCRRLVRRLLAADRAGRLRIAPLSGAWAQAWLAAHGLPADPASLVFIPDRRDPAGRPLLRTDGALAAGEVAGGGWRLLAWLRLVPTAWRDPWYRLVARSRRRLAGPGDPEEFSRPEWHGRWVE